MRGFLTFVACLVCFISLASADVLDRVRETGRFTLGYRTDAPPFSYQSADGAPMGLAAALCRDVSKGLLEALALEDLEIVYVPVTARTRFDMLQAGQIDILCGPTTQTLSRREAMDFSIPYFIDGSSVVFRAGEGQGIHDLVGRPIGYLNGTTTVPIVKKLFAEEGIVAQEIGYDTHVAGLTALADGEIAAYFGDQAILRYQLGLLRPRTLLRFSDEQFSFEPYALAMARGETRLRLVVDRVLSETFASGRIYQHITDELGEVTLSELALAVYQVSALPE